MTLPDRIEKLAGGEREMDAEIAIEIFDGGADHLDDARDVTRARKVLISHGVSSGNFEVVGFSGVSLRNSPAYTSSLDAAMTLLPDRWRLRQANFSAPCADDQKWHLNLHGGREGEDTFVGRGASMALAMVAAALRARIVEDRRG